RNVRCRHYTVFALSCPDRQAGEELQAGGDAPPISQLPPQQQALPEQLPRRIDLDPGRGDRAQAAEGEDGSPVPQPGPRTRTVVRTPASPPPPLQRDGLDPPPHPTGGHNHCCKRPVLPPIVSPGTP